MTSAYNYVIFSCVFCQSMIQNSCTLPVPFIVLYLFFPFLRKTGLLPYPALALAGGEGGVAVCTIYIIVTLLLYSTIHHLLCASLRLLFFPLFH